MAIREYIGARYVPRFMGNYDASTIYEALDVVDNGLGTSYIAKIPTPAGTALTDTTHWAIYGATSGAIINLQNQIDAIVNNDLPPMNAAINDLRYDVDVMSVKNKEILFVSDSYGSGAGSFIDQCASVLGIANYHKVAVSGDGFKNGGFLAQVSNYTGDKDAINLIVIAGGLNDSTLADLDPNLTSTMTAFDNYITVNYPNADVILCYCGCGVDNAVLLAGRTLDKRLWTAWQYQYFAEKHGWTYDDISDVLKTNILLMDADGVHPSNIGQAALSDALCSVLLTGTHSVQYPPSVMGITLTSPWASVGTLNFRYRVKDGRVTIFKPDDILYIQYTGTITGGQVYEIGTLTSLFFNKKYVISDVNCRVDASALGTYVDSKCNIIFEYDKMKIQFTKINSTHSGYDNYVPDLRPAVDVSVGVNQFSFELCDLG